VFVDEIDITAKAGDGGDGVVRWHRAKFKPKGGPAGGNGGDGGDVYVRAVRDLNVLSKYTGAKTFRAENGEHGGGTSKHGKGGIDTVIDVPIGAVVYDTTRERTYELFEEGRTEKILAGGHGGLGNEYFKSSTDRAPEKSTKGTKGEAGTFHIELSLVVDVGLIGMPNAGKSTLLNAFTNATSRVGAYQFTTLQPHLGDLFGYTIADIPGLIKGASTGKGLGHTFLRHIQRTKMLLHLVSLEHDDPKKVYYTIRDELSNYDKTLEEKEEWIILTKKDLVNQQIINSVRADIDKLEKCAFVISENDHTSIKNLQDALVKRLREG